MLERKWVKNFKNIEKKLQEESHAQDIALNLHIIILEKSH